MKNEKVFQKADSLRKQSNKSSKDLERVTDDWLKATNKAKTPMEMKLINKEFEKKYSVADRQESKAYKKYYDYVHKNFEKTVIDNCVKGGVFDKKEFIDRLKNETNSTRGKSCKKKLRT